MISCKIYWDNLAGATCLENGLGSPWKWPENAFPGATARPEPGKSVRGNGPVKWAGKTAVLAGKMVRGNCHFSR